LVALTGLARPVRRQPFAFLLATAMAASSLPAFNVGALAPFLVEDLGLSRTSLGLLVTATIAVAAVLSPLAGRLVDRLGGRLVLLVIFAVTAAGLLGMALAGSYAWLLAVAGLTGTATAMGNPATNQLVSLHIPRGAQGTVIGIKQSGVQAATMLTGLIMPSLGGALGWRRAMALSALPSLLGLAATLLLVPASGREPGAGSAPPAARVRGIPPAVARLTAYGTLMGVGVSAAGAYVLLYGTEELGVSAAVGGLALGLLGLAGIVSRITWARRIERGTSARAALVAMALGGSLAVALIWVAGLAGPWLLLAGAFAFGSTAPAWNAVGNLFLVRELPASVAGRMSGILQAGFYGGFAFGPALFGALVDRTSSYGAGWSMVIAVQVAAGGLLVVSARARARRATGRAST
jgi:predicted MFS family arabinose efflux permease